MATAVHEGHDVRPDVAARLALTPDERRREEDPATALWTVVAPHRVVVWRSRFEVDMNRPRSEAVYRRPEDAWGLRVWKAPVPDEILRESLRLYDTFYDEIHRLLARIAARHGRFVVYDLHSYNHRRKGPDGPPGDPEANPDVNLGTGSMDREFWAPVVEAFTESLREARIDGRALDVRENVRFLGGHFSAWVHRTFPKSGCCLAVEVKKTFMDEWTGRFDRARLADIRRALTDTAGPVRESLETL